MSRLITAIIWFALVLAGSVAAQDRASFNVGSATAARGQKATGVIDVPSGSDAGTNIPVAVIHGAKPGPTLALVSGAHGTEYASIIALEIDRSNRPGGDFRDRDRRSAGQHPVIRAEGSASIRWTRA